MRAAIALFPMQHCCPYHSHLKPSVSRALRVKATERSLELLDEYAKMARKSSSASREPTMCLTILQMYLLKMYLLKIRVYRLSQDRFVRYCLEVPQPMSTRPRPCMQLVCRVVYRTDTSTTVAYNTTHNIEVCVCCCVARCVRDRG